MKYLTRFKLEVAVPVVEANRYLQEPNMTEYLISDLKDYRKVDWYEAIEFIQWSMYLTGQYSDKGYILLVTNKELTQAQLDVISDWVSGQNSDGLGEGFEQHFSEYDEESDYEEIASFDWMTNKYKFHKLSR